MMMMNKYEMKALGLEVNESDANYFGDDLLWYRWLPQTGRLQAAVKKTFDRWANSVDFELWCSLEDLGLPASPQAFRSCVGPGDPGWGGAKDIGNEYL